MYGNLDPSSGKIGVYDAPGGRGPYRIDLAPNGYVYYASFAGSYLGRIDPESGKAFVLEPPIPRQGVRNPAVSSDSSARLAAHTALSALEPKSHL